MSAPHTRWEKSQERKRDENDIPKPGSVWEDPISGSHWEVTSAGPLEVKLVSVSNPADVRTVDTREWPTHYVREGGDA